MAYRNSYSRDPRWLTARFSSVCAGCEGEIEKSSRIFYYPIGKKTYCETCGETHSRDFEAAAFDEAAYGGGF